MALLRQVVLVVVPQLGLQDRTLQDKALVGSVLTLCGPVGVEDVTGVGWHKVRGNGRDKRGAGLLTLCL